jgi:hypothetical protein
MMESDFFKYDILLKAKMVINNQKMMVSTQKGK